MPNNIQPTDYVAIVSASVGVVSAFLAFLSFRQAKSINISTIKKQQVENVIEKLDNCYLGLNEFLHNYSGTDETKEKRLSREKVIYLLNVLRTQPLFNNNKTTQDKYSILEMKISDITYDSNFEKVTRDLATISTEISFLKSELLNFSPHDQGKI